MAHRTEHGITFFDFATISEAQAALNDDGVDLEEHEYWDREIEREHAEEEDLPVCTCTSFWTQDPNCPLHHPQEAQ